REGRGREGLEEGDHLGEAGGLVDGTVDGGAEDREEPDEGVDEAAAGGGPVDGMGGPVGEEPALLGHPQKGGGPDGSRGAGRPGGGGCCRRRARPGGWPRRGRSPARRSSRGAGSPSAPGPRRWPS